MWNDRQGGSKGRARGTELKGKGFVITQLRREPPSPSYGELVIMK